MSTQTGAFVLAVLFAVGTAGVPCAAGASESMPGSGPLNVREGGNVSPKDRMLPPMVQGELLRIDGRDYVVKDRFGKEIRFQLDERTLLRAHPKIGDQIIADVEPQGYAYSIDMAGH